MRYALIICLLLASSIEAQIDKNNLMNTINFLSSKELDGRLPGSEGYFKAANFIKEELKKLNLKPAVGKDYFQKLNVEYNQILPGEHFAIIKDGKRIEYKLGTDYVYRGFTGSGQITAPVAFCGYGLNQPEIGYNDYKDIDVKGKVVMVFKSNPKWNIDGKTFTNGNPREKAIVASLQGAVAILFVSLPNDENPQKPIGSILSGQGEQMLNFPELHIDFNIASELFDRSSYTLKQLQTKIDESKTPTSINLLHRADINVKTEYVKEKESVNVAALLKGSDPILKNEYLILGAHLDHVGGQASKIYFPGANDNASGAAALLEIARAFVKKDIKPKRSIAFVFFTSEEQGLYGATHFANNLPFPKESVQAMFNLDCVGCGDSIQIGGGKSASELWNMAKQIDLENDKLLVANTWSGGGADAEPFFKIGIPTLYFVTTNGYPHLHLASDKPETLNQNLLQSITNLAFKTTVKAASIK